jgi:hypothetical protein
LVSGFPGPDSFESTGSAGCISEARIGGGDDRARKSAKKNRSLAVHLLIILLKESCGDIMMTEGRMGEKERGEERGSRQRARTENHARRRFYACKDALQM